MRDAWAELSSAPWSPQINGQHCTDSMVGPSFQPTAHYWQKPWMEILHRSSSHSLRIVFHPFMWSKAYNLSWQIKLATAGMVESSITAALATRTTCDNADVFPTCTLPAFRLCRSCAGLTITNSSCRIQCDAWGWFCVMGGLRVGWTSDVVGWLGCHLTGGSWFLIDSIDIVSGLSDNLCANSSSISHRRNHPPTTSLRVLGEFYAVIVWYIRLRPLVAC